MSRHLRCAAHVLALVTLFAPAGHARQGGAALTNERIFAASGIHEGSTVCEIGAGDGALSIEAARVAGPEGRVLASELGDDRVTALRGKIAAARLPQIAVVAGSVDATNFPDGACDAILLRDVYHHFSDPAAMNAAIARALKPDGRVSIVDFTPPGQEAAAAADRGKDGMHGVNPETVTRELNAAGLELVSSERGGRWFLSVYRRRGPG